MTETGLDTPHGRIAIVTGGAKGLGRNICHALARAGAGVVVCDIDGAAGRAVEAALREAGFDAWFRQVDLAERGAPQRMVCDVAAERGRLDILVNNARARAPGGFFDEDEDSWEAGMTVGLRAPFFASQQAVQAMAPNGGCIVNISSVLALMSCGESPVYHVAKAGMLQMTRHCALHAGPYGVRVNAVLPGFIVKDEHRARYAGDDNERYRCVAEFCHPLRRIGSSDDVAAAVVFLCSDGAAFITGQCLTVDGGLLLQEQSSLVYAFDAARN